MYSLTVDFMLIPPPPLNIFPDKKGGGELTWYRDIWYFPLKPVFGLTPKSAKKRGGGNEHDINGRLFFPLISVFSTQARKKKEEKIVREKFSSTLQKKTICKTFYERKFRKFFLPQNLKCAWKQYGLFCCFFFRGKNCFYEHFFQFFLQTCNFSRAL